MDNTKDASKHTYAQARAQTNHEKNTAEKNSAEHRQKHKQGTSKSRQAKHRHNHSMYQQQKRVLTLKRIEREMIPVSLSPDMTNNRIQRRLAKRR